MTDYGSALTIYIITVAAVFGAVMGSFINCMAARIVSGESVLHGRSHCAVCGHTLSGLDLVPVFSYLFLGGKCRYCKEKISPRYMVTELLMATAFGLAVWRYGLEIETATAMVMACILMGLSLVDFESFEIPDGFIIAAIIWWGASLFFAQDIKGQLISSGAAAIALGGGMLALSLVFDKLTGKESLGGGDIKLFFVTGLYLGLWVGLFNLILACIFGLATVVIRRDEKVPFGPAISMATFVSLLFGEGVVQWYLGLFY